MRGRTLIALIAFLTLSLLAAVGLGLWLAIETSPAIAAQGKVSTRDIERALRLLRSHDPRYQRPGIVRLLMADERDLALLLQHAAARWAGASTQVTIAQGMAHARASIPGHVQGRPIWINVDVQLRQGRGLPDLESLRVGRLPLPGWAVAPMLRWWLERRGLGVDLELPRDVVRHVDFRPRQVVLYYAWREDTMSRMLATLVPAADQERLRAYSDRLVELLRDEAAGGAVSLARLLPPMFDMARRRSALPSADAARENRAAILTLAFYANRRGLVALVPAARQWPRPRALTVTLAGRIDLPLHFLISAAIAAESGTPLADAVGLYKEVSDSRGGSGFSFSDLAADRAGTRLGERAVRNPAWLQERLAAGAAESDLLPDITDLPEFLSAEDFGKRYGHVEAPPYLLMMREIETRLDTLALLR